MRITVSMPSTGIVFAPGLARPVVIDTDDLPAAVAEKLKRLAEAAQLFEHAEAAPSDAPKQLRDAQEFLITVEAGDKQRTLHVSDPVGAIANPSLREFVQLVRDQAALQRQKDKPD
jgi:Emfourin